MLILPDCKDSRTCFAKRQRMGSNSMACGVLHTVDYKDGECPFCKPFGNYTNDKYYPYNGFTKGGGYSIPGFITVRDAAKRWAVPLFKVRQAISDGLIEKAKVVNGIIYIPEETKRPSQLFERSV